MEIIAEIGQNHNGDMSIALDMIDCAKENGADVVKFQVYDAKSIFSRDNNPWYEYNCRTELTRDQIFLLSEKCARAGVEFMASVFDTERVSWLEEAGVKRYKIASRSIHDKELIDRLCRTNKPLLVSLGMWKGAAFPSIPSGNKVDFMYCVSKYPTDLCDIKLNDVDFKKYSGFSDHTIGIAAAVAAISRGANIIEKHFTLDRSMYGPDHVCSMTPGDLKTLDIFRKQITEVL